jgi:hypothetical protein
MCIYNEKYLSIIVDTSFSSAPNAPTPYPHISNAAALNILLGNVDCDFCVGNESDKSEMM